MLRIDAKPFKEEMYAIIDAADVNMSPDEARLEIVERVKEHRIPINANKYASNVVKLILVKNKDRAKKLVDCFDDRPLSYFGEFLVRLTSRIIVLGLLAGFIVLVIMLYNWISG